MPDGEVCMALIRPNVKLTVQTKECIREQQAEFSKDRRTTQQILALRLITEGARRKNKQMYNCFVESQKTFDSIGHKVTWAIFESYRVDRRLVKLFKDINENADAAVRMISGIGSQCNTIEGREKEFVYHYEL
jgi:hypothetical protein